MRQGRSGQRESERNRQDKGFSCLKLSDLQIHKMPEALSASQKRRKGALFALFVPVKGVRCCRKANVTGSCQNSLDIVEQPVNRLAVWRIEVPTTSRRDAGGQYALHT